jgi:Zn-dependent protease
VDDDPRTATPPAPDEPGWTVARVAGVPVRLRGSAVVTLVVLWVILHVQLAPAVAVRAWWVAPSMATLTTLGFGLSVVVHELAHAAVARALYLPVTGITVFHLGGATHLAREPEDWRDETAVAVAGPLANLTAAGALLVAGSTLGAGSATGAVLVLLGYVNASIGLFNLLPGHPLDGGALLRAATWAVTGDPDGALRLSSRLGQALGTSLVVGGVLGALPVAPGDGDSSWLWLALVGAFVLHAARIGVIRGTVRAALAGVRVADLTRASAFDAFGSHTVATAVAAVTRAGTAGLVLDGQGHAVGTFGPDELASVPEARWSHLTIEETMRPVQGSVPAEQLVLDAVAAFGGARDAVLAVLHAGRPVGTLAAADVLAHVDRSTGPNVPGRGQRPIS